MWCILSDNLSVNNILDLCENVDSKEFKHNFYFQSYLYALILWDAIYKAPRKSVSTQIYNESERRRQEKQQENEIIKNVRSTFFDLPYNYQGFEIETVANDIYYEWIYSDEYEESRVVKEETFFYLVLGQIANMNVLLSEQRSNFVQKSKIVKKIWSREDVLKYLDKEIYEICKELYLLMDKEMLSIQTPLLVDYICEYATSLQDAVNIALQLKEHKDVIYFRQTMNLLDNAINKGNMLQLKEYLGRLDEIVAHLCQKDVATKKIEIEFTITPSLANPSISTMFGIPIEYNKKKKVNMNFLIELARYGLSRERNYLL